ncbi:hybrid sensor and regulator [Duganella sp. Leaf126]|uniref:PAS domain-containing protein n=1 Tax=Duganella sp. Leaf126 TaxID=1736266 RepID=UPI000701DFAA|nr:PAS domain-containing protein [Duganella sp. Leaf126]KQQ40308.1 hybrid sensor and regulator [Duganella sp. Leaf126]
MPQKARLPSIRAQIALLVLACSLPTTIGFGAVVQQFYSRERDALMEDTRKAARMVATAIDRDLVQSEGAARALAISPSIRDNDMAALRLQAGGLLGPQFPASQFLLSDSSGQVAMHMGAPLPDTFNPINNASRLQPLFDTARPQLSVVYVAGSALLAIDVPVFVENRVVSAVTALLKPQQLDHILRDERIKLYQTMALYDRQGRLVAQSGGPRQLLGQAADPALRARLAQASDALFSTTDTEGVAIYQGYSRSPVSGATVVISTPQAKALEELLHAVTTIALILALVLLAGFSLAWLVGGRIARSVRALVGPAEALAGDRPFTLEPMTFREADAVAQAFNALAADLKAHRHGLEQLVGERTEQLERSRSQLETLYATAPVGLSYVDNELRIIRVNDFLARVTGQPVLAHIGRHIGDMVRDPALRRAILADYRTVLDTGRPLVGVEHTGAGAEAAVVRHFVASYYPQFGPAGTVTAITGLLLDVTDQKRIAAELHRSQQLLGSVVENLPAVIFVKRASDLRFEMVNRYAAVLAGRSSGEDFIGKTDFDFYPPELAERYNQADRAVLASSANEITEIAEEPIVGARGATRYLTTRKVALRDEDGVATHILVLGMDITEPKQVKETLRATVAQLGKSEQFLRTLTDSLPGMVAYWDAGLRCRFANRYFLDWYGMDQQQMLGAFMPDVMKEAAYAQSAPHVQRALEGEPQGFAGELHWPSGQIGYTWVNYIPDVGEFGEVRGFFVLVSDVTELKEAELHLQEVNEEMVLARDRAEAANRAKSEFLANMSHEIRTPMNAIIGLARLLQEAPLAPRERGYLDKIQVATQSLLGLVNDVLELSRVEAGQLQLEHAPFQLRHILDSISVLISGSAADKGIALVYDIDPHLPNELAGDPMRLQQVLLNLLSNAVKFTAAGEVVLSVRAIGGGHDWQAGRAILLEFSVRDTGIGIPLAQQEHIFATFSQADSSTSRKFGGVGLGLAICRQLADMMGGAVHVRSEVGHGAEFLFTCPLECTAPPQPPEVPAAAQGMTVLVADANPGVRGAIAAACHWLGWQVDEAADAGQLRAMLAGGRDDGLPYELLLLDRDLPGLDGDLPGALAPAPLADAAIRRAVPPILPPIVPPILLMVSEHEAATVLRDLDGSGAAGVLSKPVSPHRLLDRIRALMSGDHGDGASASVPPSPLNGRLAGMRILLVEDNEINQEVAQYMLLHAGASVDLVGNGQLAVQRLLADASRYDVVLMDVQMPVMNGYDATVAIRAAGLTLPVVAMTANVMEEDRQRAADVGMDAHVAKPVDVEMLIALLRDLAPHAAGPAAPTATVAAAPVAPAAYALPPDLPGIDLDTALARMGGNFDALAALLKRFERTQGDAVLAVRAALVAGEDQTARQLLHRLRGVAANLGANEVARMAAQVECALHANHADSAVHAALDQLATALAVVADGIRLLNVDEQIIPYSNTDRAELVQKLAHLQSLLQNNNLKALEDFAALRPALADMEHAVPLAQAVDNLDFDAAAALVHAIMQGVQGKTDGEAAMKQRKDNA